MCVFDARREDNVVGFLRCVYTDVASDCIRSASVWIGVMLDGAPHFYYKYALVLWTAAVCVAHRMKCNFSIFEVATYRTYGIGTSADTNLDHGTVLPPPVVAAGCSLAKAQYIRMISPIGDSRITT